MKENEFFIWEENDLTERPMKLESNQTFAQSDGINETKNVSVENVCEDTGSRKKWKRNCPKCGKELHCSSKKYLNHCNKHNTLCYACAFSIPKSELHRKNLSLSLIGKKLSKERIEKIKIGYNNLSEEKKLEKSKKISKSCKGKLSGRKGKQNSIESNLKRRTATFNWSDEFKRKIIERNKNRKISDETRRKMRLARIRYIEKVRFFGGRITPRFNIKACEYFDNLNKERRWNLQHALNGGEHYVKELGYWLDGYDKEKNIVVEYDENYHNRNKDKDARRMNEIKLHLNCKFFRYDKVSGELKEY